MGEYKRNIGFMEHILAPGDTVQVMAKPAATPTRGIWPCAWIEVTMTPLIGQTMTIKSIHDDSIAVEENEWVWPAFVLKRVDKKLDNYTVNLGYGGVLLGKGMRVRVERKKYDNEYWPLDAWHSNHDNAIGKEFIVEKVTDEGVHLKYFPYIFPAFVLRVLSDKSNTLLDEYTKWYNGLINADRYKLDDALTHLLNVAKGNTAWHAAIDELLQGKWNLSSVPAGSIMSAVVDLRGVINLTSNAGPPSRRRRLMGMFLDQHVRGASKQLAAAHQIMQEDSAVLAQLAASTVSAVSFSIDFEDTTMLQPTKIEQRTYVSLAGGGFANAADMSDDSIIAHIAQVEQEIERLKQIKAKPQALKNRITELQSGIDALVTILDARTETPAKKK